MYAGEEKKGKWGFPANLPLLFPSQLSPTLCACLWTPQTLLQAPSTLLSSCPLGVHHICMACPLGVSVICHCVTSSPKFSNIKQLSFVMLITHSWNLTGLSWVVLSQGLPYSCSQKMARALVKVWLSGLSSGLQTKGSLVQFLVRAHAWVADQVPSWGYARGN